MNYRRLGGGVGVIKMTHCESHIWWTQEISLVYAPLYLEEPWLWSFVQLEKTLEQMLFFAGASTYRTTSLTTELTCRCHLCTTPFCSLQRAFILGFNLSWSFDGDFYFCFVGWVVLGFWVLGGGGLFVFLTYLSYQRGQKGEKKIPSCKIYFAF